MRFWPVVIAVSLVGLDAWPCPTCVGPRLGDTSRDGLQVRGALRTSLGSDSFDGTSRWELRNELSAGIAYGDGAIDLELPLLWREIGGDTLTGFGDIAVKGSVELLRHEAPDASDTLRLLPGLGIPTSGVPRLWQWSLSTQAVTPSMGLGFRHSDQQWAVSALAFGGLPIALKDSAFSWGPSVGVGAAFEYSPWRWLSGRLALDFKQQWAAHDAAGPINDTQSTALFAGVEARVTPMRQLAIAAALTQPLFCFSPGDYTHGRVYRLGVELAL